MSISPVYTLTVYEEDDETVLFEVSTDPAHQAPFLKAFDNFPEQEIDFTKGAASIGQMNVQIVDVANEPLDQATGYMTGLLSDPTGGSQLMGHRVVAEQDIGSGKEKILDGVIKAVRLLDSYSAYELELRDIRERERKTKAFQATDTPTILPRGVLNGYGNALTTGRYPLPATEPLTARYRAEVATSGVIDYTDANQVERTLTPPMREALESTAPLESDPATIVYDRWKVLWRNKATGGPYTTVDQIASRAHNVIGRRAFVEGNGRIVYLVLNNSVSGAALPSDNEEIEVIVQYDGPVSEEWPLHIQDVTVGQLLRALYRGDYSDEDPRIRYEEAALLALRTWVRAIIKEPADDLRAWAEKHAYPIAHAAPALNADGEISPVTYLLPDATVTVPTLSDSNLRPAGGGWSHSASDAINVVHADYLRDYRVSPGEREGLALSDQLRSVTQPVTARHRASIALNGEQALKIETTLLRAIGNSDGSPIYGDSTDERGAKVALRISQQILDRFAVGGQYFAVEGRRTDADIEALEVGDYVIVGSTWHPDYNTGERGANRLAQVLGRRNLNAAWTSLTLIDAGSANAPLAQPTLGTVTVDSDGIITVPVTDQPDDAVTRIDYAVSATEPDADSEEWTLVDRVQYTSSGSPISVKSPPIPQGATAWVRARSEGVGRRPSAYTTAVSVTATAQPRILDSRLILDDVTAIPTVSWVVNDQVLGIRLHYEVHDAGTDPTLVTTVDVDAALGTHEFTSLRVPRGKVITVQIEPWTSWTGSAVGGSAGEVVEKRVDGELTPTAPWVQADFDRDAVTETATLTLSIRDGRGTITAVEYSKREGSQSGDVFAALSSTWDSSPSTPPYDGDWVVTIAVPPGEESAIKWKVSFTDIEGTSRTVGSTHYTAQIDEHETQIRVFFASGVLMDNDADNAPDDTQLQNGVIQPTTLLFPVWVRCQLHLREGAQVTALRGRVYNADGPGGGTNDSVTVFFQVFDNDGGAVSSQTAESAAGGWQTVENLLVSRTVSPTESYYIDCTVRSDDDLTHARALWGEVDVIRHSTRET